MRLFGPHNTPSTGNQFLNTFRQAFERDTDSIIDEISQCFYSLTELYLLEMFIAILSSLGIVWL